MRDKEERASSVSKTVVVNGGKPIRSDTVRLAVPGRRTTLSWLEIVVWQESSDDIKSAKKRWKNG